VNDDRELGAKEAAVRELLQTDSSTAPRLKPVISSKEPAMPKRISKNQRKDESNGKAAQSPRSGQSEQIDDPQSEFSVPQKWKDNDVAPAAATGSSSASASEHGPLVEGSESVDRR